MGVTYKLFHSDGRRFRQVFINSFLLCLLCSANIVLSAHNDPPEAPYAISLGAIDESLPGVVSNTVAGRGGQMTQIHFGIDRVNAVAGLGGFDLRVVFDTSALFLQSASPGSIYDECGWEFFTWRLDRPGEVHIIGLADQNDGSRHPGCATPTPYIGQLPATLASISFLAKKAIVVSGQCFPVSFYWSDCGDNILSDSYGQAMTSFTVTNANDSTPINDSSANLPTLFGMPQSCSDQTTALRQVDYQNGQICFVDECPSGICSKRGDLNNNGLAYEVGDAVLFSNFFMLGFEVFGNHVSESIVASDIDADGLALTLIDLFHMFRIVLGEEDPIPVSSPIVLPIVGE